MIVYMVGNIFLTCGHQSFYIIFGEIIFNNPHRDPHIEVELNLYI